MPSTRRSGGGSNTAQDRCVPLAASLNCTSLAAAAAAASLSPCTSGRSKFLDSPLPVATSRPHSVPQQAFC